MDKDKSKKKVFFGHHLNQDLNDILKGLKFSFGIILGLSLFFGIVFAVGFHSADEILGGTFNGNYNFNGNVSINSIDISPAKSQTINLDNSMTRNEIQTLIDSVPKYIPKGTTINFQFTSGTYTLDNYLMFTGFYGGGTLNILGNGGEANAGTLHNNQEVILDFSATDTNGVLFQQNSILTEMKNIKIITQTHIVGNLAINVIDCSARTYIRWNAIEGTGTGFGSCLNSQNSNIYSVQNYISNCKYGIYSSFSNIYSNENEYDPSSTQPQYGLSAVHGGTITKNSATQPTGSVQNEFTSTGGEIR